jgi:hypothetical protein
MAGNILEVVGVVGDQGEAVVFAKGGNIDVVIVAGPALMLQFNIDRNRPLQKRIIDFAHLQSGEKASNFRNSFFALIAFRPRFTS